MKAPARKPRIQGKIAHLKPEQRERIHQWFRENLHYKEIARRAYALFGVKIAQSSLCEYYKTHSAEIFSEGASAQMTLSSKELRLPLLRIEIQPVLISSSYSGEKKT